MAISHPFLFRNYRLSHHTTTIICIILLMATLVQLIHIFLLATYEWLNNSIIIVETAISLVLPLFASMFVYLLTNCERLSNAKSSLNKVHFNFIDRHFHGITAIINNKMRDCCYTQRYEISECECRCSSVTKSERRSFIDTQNKQSIGLTFA